MNVPETTLEIIKNNHCPLYKLGEEFRLSGRMLTLPPGKATCMVLVDDIREAVVTYAFSDEVHTETSPVYQFNCSGPSTACTGVVRVEYRMRKTPVMSREDEEKAEKIRSIVNVLAKFPIFEGLNEQQLRELGAYLKYKQLPEGATVISQGEPGVNLFIIAAGMVEVIGDDDMRIAYLGKGEVFGEMSLISGDKVGATVRVAEPAKLLFIKGKDFGRVLNRYPSLQMYFARLLARRLADTNVARSEEFSSGMTGKLSEVPPSELFQTLNVNQKTGGTDLMLSRGNARVGFKQGELIWAAYDGKTGTDAFFEILAEKEGRFKFSPDLSAKELKSPILGDFMWLLMEGIRKIDEDNVV